MFALKSGHGRHKSNIGGFIGSGDSIARINMNEYKALSIPNMPTLPRRTRKGETRVFCGENVFIALQNRVSWKPLLGRYGDFHSQNLTGEKYTLRMQGK